jgi:hypothetical protein
MSDPENLIVLGFMVSSSDGGPSLYSIPEFFA